MNISNHALLMKVPLAQKELKCIPQVLITRANLYISCILQNNTKIPLM